ADGCDVGIRLEQGLGEHMTAVPVSPLIKLGTVAAPDYLKEHGIPETPQERSNHNCLRLWHKSSGALFAWECSNVVGGNE
ncbi:LysR family transcriptional regulator, partial [Escherichia coli]